PERAEHPHQATGRGAGGVVVGDDRGALGDPGAAQRGREVLGFGQRVPARVGAGGGGELDVEVEVHSAGQVPGQVGVVSLRAVERPAHVEQVEGAPTGGGVLAQGV